MRTEPDRSIEQRVRGRALTEELRIRGERYPLGGRHYEL